MKKSSKAVKKAEKDLAKFVEESEKELRGRVSELQRANDRLSRQLSMQAFKKTEAVDAVYRAVADIMPGLILNPTPASTSYRKCKRQTTAETAVILAADWQLGKQTPDYDTEKCEERAHELADKVCYLTDIQRADHPIHEARVYALGDFVEGELIFPGQAHGIDSSLYRQVCVDGPRIFGDFLRRMLGHFSSVKVIAVSGNHGKLGGRSRREYHPETNADRFVYNITAKVLNNESRLSWYIPDMLHCEPLGFWYATDRIGDKRFLLFHGDQMRGGGFAGIPIYGFFRALAEWGSGIIEGGFDYAVCVTPDTEALTPTGWRRPDQLLAGAPIATYNRETEALEWQVPGAVREFNYTGPLLHYCGKTMDHLMTPEHRMWARLPQADWQKRPAWKTLGGNWLCRVAAETAQTGMIPTDVVDVFGQSDPHDVLRFIGWYLAEGSIDSGYRVDIAQSRDRHPRRYRQICDLVQRLGFRPSRDPLKVRVCATRVATWMSENFRTGCTNKRMPLWLKALPLRSLEVLLEAMIAGDGSIVSPTCKRYTTTSPQLADDVQEVALKLGWACTATWRQRPNRQPACDLTLVRRTERRMPRQPPESQPYDGRVWCPTVANGLWFARRHGKVVVTGNCGHWHKCSSLLLNNKRILFIAGSTESKNVWAAEELKQKADPSQYLLFCHPKQGVTSEHRVWLK